MILLNKKNTPDLYADLYSNYKITGTPFLAYRDLPSMLPQYVHGKNALDYGSGSGESSLFLKALGYNVISTDINEKMISISQARDPLGEYIKINSGVLPFKNETFDLVFCSFVLLEIEEKEEILKIVKEVRRTLKRGGVFVSIAASDDTYKYDWLTLKANFPENQNIISGSKVRIEFKDIDLTIYDYFWKQDDYIGIFEQAGLSVIKTHNPIGKEDDGYAWKDEKFVSPCSIIISKNLEL